jgi:hypothetical protein
MNKKTTIIIGIAFLLIILPLSVYYFTPQEAWVPSSIKKIVNSCYKENSNIPTISSLPECCYGLKKSGYPSANGEMVIGSKICLK